MKILVFLLLVISINTTGVFAFDRFYGLETDLATESWPTPDGGLIVGGLTISPTSVNSAWLIKLHSNGTYEWQKKFDSGSILWISSLAVTAQGDYIVAGSLGNNGADAWIAKLESDGDIQWERKFGGVDNEELHSIKQLSDGTYVAAGSVCVSAGYYCDGIVTRLDQNGTIQWIKKYGTTQYHERVAALEHPLSTEIICTGTIQDSGSQVIRSWVLRLDLNGGIVASTGYNYSGYIVPGYASSPITGGRVILGPGGAVVRLNNAGALVWGKQYTPVIDGFPQEFGVLTTIARDGDNLILGGGIASGAPDYFIWVMKIDGNGLVLWSKVRRIVIPSGFQSPDLNFENSNSKFIEPQSYISPDFFSSDKVTSVHVIGSKVIVSGFTNNFDCGRWDFFVAQLNNSDGSSCFFTEDTQVNVQSFSVIDIVSQSVPVTAAATEFSSVTSVANASGSSADACPGLGLMATTQCGGANTISFDFPNPTTHPDTRVLIHNHGTSAYPNANQTQDRKIKIKATVRNASGQPVDGHWVYFTVKDPPDSSAYVSNPSVGDNLETVVPPPNDPLSGTLVLNAVESANGGVAETELFITDEFAGDNYLVEARFNSLTDPVQATSGTLTAWKRMYVEHDRMYKVGGFVINDSGPGSGNPVNKVYVSNVGTFAVGNAVHVFSANNPTGQAGTVVEKSGNSLTLSFNLNSFYPTTVTSISCDPFVGTFTPYCAKHPFGFVAKVSGGTYDVFPNDMRYDRAFKDPFVELKVISSNFLPAWPNINVTQLGALGPWIAARTFDFFDNKNTPNHIQLVSAGNHQVTPQPPYGLSAADGPPGFSNTSWVFWQRIKNTFSPYQNALDSTTAHELGHQWNINLSYPLNGECQQIAWLPLGSDPKCLMNQSRTRPNGVQSFHITNPSEIWCIRKHVDNLFVDPTVCP